jgi:hypothetical protein
MPTAQFPIGISSHDQLGGQFRIAGTGRTLQARHASPGRGHRILEGRFFRASAAGRRNGSLSGSAFRAQLAAKEFFRRNTLNTSELLAHAPGRLPRNMLMASLRRNGEKRVEKK